MLNVGVPKVRNQPGAALFWPGGSEAGWDHPPLYLPKPILIIRVNRTGSHAETPEGERIAYHDDQATVPFQWLEEIYDAMEKNEHTTGRRLFSRPVFPIATISMTYEYGRFFHPHSHCFPNSNQSEGADLFIAIHCTGFTYKDGGWKIVGRKPSPKLKWRDWTIPRHMCEWPKPIVPIEKSPPIIDIGNHKFGMTTPQMSYADYGEAIQKIRHHLYEGDIYQANLTMRFLRHTSATPEAIFKAGLNMGGERYSCLMAEKERTHISFSPELFLRRWGSKVTTKPIKGTIHYQEGDDMAEKQQTLYSEKNRAEHVMIVDLERNDLGRISLPGSIRTEPLMKMNKHRNLLHLESTVSGTLDGNRSFRDLVSRIFPGGSVTGAPKKRALEIISEIEKHPRGIYCGAMGWVDQYGDCDLNLPIRTATWNPDGRMHLYSGGGIVADSEADSEWQEMHTKLAFMDQAISLAENTQTETT